MNIIVLGSTGMLGRYVFSWANQKHPTCGYSRQLDFDASDFDKSTGLQAFLKSYLPPFVVINCVGAIKQKVKDKETLFKINGEFPVKLAKFLSQIKHSKMIHVSSDCVYSGASGPYTEADISDANDAYGQSKAAGEKCSENWNCKVIRTSIIGDMPTSNVSLLEWVKSQNGKTVNGYVNHLWNGVTCLQLAKICVYLAQNFEEYFHSLYNIHSPEAVTKYDLIKCIANVYALKMDVNPISHFEKIDRRLASNYSLYGCPPLHQQIKEQKDIKVS